MSRPGDKISVIKSKMTLASLLDQVTVRRRISGEWELWECPFCQSEKTRKDGKPHEPRFWVNTRLEISNCFHPRCQALKPMDVINLYARLRGITNSDAIRRLFEQISNT